MSARAPAARDGESRRARRSQLVLFSALAAAALALFAAWIAGGSGGAPRPEARVDAELAGPGTAEDSWIRRSETRLGGIDRRLRDLEAEAGDLARENERLRQQLAADAGDARRTIDSQAAVIEQLRRERDAAGTGAPGGTMFPPAGVPPADAARAANGPAKSEAPAPPPLIEIFQLDDAAETFGASGVRGLGVWLPAGAHAQAVVLAGVDASASVASQGDPRPVLLRITGPAWTAAPSGAETALRVELAGCTVTGAAHGDLSSEKVYARLRTLTCAGEEPGTAVETRVAGFVAGSGKVGVRGPVVSREGALVEKAFLAGLVSGLGEGVSGAFAPQAVANTGLGDIGRAGLGAGARSAGGKVADYLIRRAEQYQPVIQLQAGTPVTVVFIEGAWLDGRDAKQGGNDGR